MTNDNEHANHTAEQAGPTVDSPPPALNDSTAGGATRPKRNFRFLVIYIILLFSVSAVFLVSSYYADRNESVSKDYLQASLELAMAQSDIKFMQTEKASLLEEMAALAAEKEEAIQAGLVWYADSNAKSVTIAGQNTEINVLKQKVADLEKELNELRGDQETTAAPE